VPGEEEDSARLDSSSGSDSSSTKSVLFPASMTARCGEAKARASFKNVGKALNEA
jgi:hypothetical protein